MTIEEAIKHAKEKAEEQRKRFDYLQKIRDEETYSYDDVEKIFGCNACAEEHEQLAEWLEELKIFKELYPDADVKGSLVTNYNNGWNDAIDKFNNAIKTFVIRNGTIPNNFNSDMIAEQLKEKNDVS